eukprot:TRINITY_DN4565_c0_g1_i2.p1 TRINITY_DN4565_c0_g1~~TRINITY_DN4565_c0_g1_i2.p1  ORF type:complete len:298 (+),score=23.48 TRINITY_DN4565_c0_g1_i2:177-1070(+)
MNENANKGTVAPAPKPTHHRGALARDGPILKESIFGLFCGFLYGITSPIVGQPLDTVKTKMQAQPEYAKGGMIRTFKDVIRREGFMALYKGLIPPLVGSTIFRSIQFGVYNAAYTFMKDSEYARAHIPFSGGVEWRVILAGICSSSARSVIETPLEVIKIRRQLNQQWTLRSLYTGFWITWMRTTGLMCTFFVLVDTGVRHFPEIINAPLYGPFIKGGICATLAWWVVWPFEALKSQIQATDSKNITMKQRWAAMRAAGMSGIFRGIVPGSVRSVVANGASMLVFTTCQDMRAHFGH